MDTGGKYFASFTALIMTEELAKKALEIIDESITH